MNDPKAALPSNIGYDDASRLARDADPRIRSSLAARRDIPEEVLYYLADDEGTPRQADVFLARDADPSVRTELATKLTRLAPGLDPEEQEKLYRLTEQALLILAQDQVVRVREILSETLGALDTAPREVIECLARDPVLSVAGPVLRASPLLHDDLLREIIESEPIQGALAAIAERDSLAAPVADAIFSAGDIAATARLLANPSAQIREETLDMIAAAAEPVPEWHEPLVRRPHLSGTAVRHIAGFVATRFLDRLQRRDDLDDTTLEAVAQIVARRLDAAPDDPEDARPGPAARRGGPVDPDWAAEAEGQETATERAAALLQAGVIDEFTIVDTLAAGDRALAIAAFALKTELPEAVLSRTIAMRNAKGIVALAWKAGFSMRFAVRAQIQLAGIAPDNVLRPTTADEYPMDRQELLWQLGFVSGESN